MKKDMLDQAQNEIGSFMSAQNAKRQIIIEEFKEQTPMFNQNANLIRQAADLTKQPPQMNYLNPGPRHVNTMIGGQAQDL